MFQNPHLNNDETLTCLFITETHEQLEKFVEILLNWDQNQGESRSEINELFRIAHNIKGSSGMMGLSELKDAVHMVENLFDGVRKEQFELDSELIDSLLKFSDEVLAYIEKGDWQETEVLSLWKTYFDNGISEMPVKAVQREDAPLTLTSDEKAEVAVWQESGKYAYGIEVQFYPEAEMQGASSLIFLKALPKYGTVFKTAPKEEDLKAEKFTILKIILLTEEPLIPEQESAIAAYPMYDVTNVKIRQWVYRPEEKVTIVTKPDKSDSVTPVERTIRVEAQKIDKLVNHIGELINIKANLGQLLDYKQQIGNKWNLLIGVAQRLEQVVDLLQIEVMDLRMVQVRNLFTRFSRIVYDISKQKEKQVELVLFGEDTEIDKQVAEQLVDPLTHLIRNAVDHGLENEETRMETGKSRIGKITLGAYQEGEYIVISVSDDGQGLNLDKIRDKGIKNGLITETEELTDEEIQKLIFQPGFSTAEQISDISGRGVGLDVVQDSIKRLKGDIVINSTHGQGSTFYLKVPLTLAIIQSFMVKIGGQIFGIPAADVIESIAIDIQDIHKITDKRVFSLRQEVITLLDLGKIFNLQSRVITEKIPVIIVKHGRNNYGLLVEDLIGQEEIMIKQINKALAENPLISGAAFVGSGEIALVLDTHQIIKKYTH